MASHRYIFTLWLFLALALVPASASASAESGFERDSTVSTQPTKKQKKQKKAKTEKSKIKKGWNFGPLPAVGYNSDLGFQFGALCDIYYYGDGSTFPQYLHKFNVEVAFYTKGSGIVHFYYDSKYLIPGIRTTFTASYLPNRKMNFYGFNGYASPFDKSLEDAKKSNAFYSMSRDLVRVRCDFQGEILPHFKWLGGLSYWYYDLSPLNIKKYAGKPTLYSSYIDHGVIPYAQRRGGQHIELKAGLVYDSRDHEPMPSRGIFTDVSLYGSPDIIQQRGDSYLKLSAHFRHYITLAKNRLVLAYHLAYQGLLWGNAPWYTLSNISTIYQLQVYSEGLGSINTIRGMLFDRVIGDGYAWGNVELRCRLFDFRLINQGWSVAVNPFFDAGQVVQPYRLSQMRRTDEQLIYSGKDESLHMSAGIGAKLIMNQNFIISVEWAMPFNKSDGSNGFNIGLNYIF